MGSASAHILPAWLGARQVLSGCGGEGGEDGIMTAESISASGDGVRSKSRWGGGDGCHAARARLSLSHRRNDVTLLGVALLVMTPNKHARYHSEFHIHRMIPLMPGSAVASFCCVGFRIKHSALFPR